MGYWKFNPPDPCCNPPAGWCQCQPCRWRAPLLRAPWLDAEGNGVLPLPQPVFRGATRHQTIKLNGGITQDGPPWYRMWRGLTTYQILEGGISQGVSTDSWLVFWFGFAWWRLPAGWTPRDRYTFGILYRGITNDPTGFPVPQEEGPFGGFMWIHEPGLSPPWDCWGRNTLYYVGDTEGEFNELQFASVEPDL